VIHSVTTDEEVYRVSWAITLYIIECGLSEMWEALSRNTWHYMKMETVIPSKPLESSTGNTKY